jgi:uroporphyrinogen decarboxylase
MALEGQRPPHVPWSYRFTKEARQSLVDHFGTEDLEPILQNHILELGSDIGFFTDLGGNLYEDVFGVVWDRRIDKDIGDVSNQVLRGAVLKGYSFPDPLDKRFFEDIGAKIGRYPDRFRLFCIGFSLWERAWTMRGMERLMMDFHDHPSFVRELLHGIANYNISQVEHALTYDIDAVYFGDDWGQQHGLLMGYPLWKEFIYPVLKRMYRVVKDAGKYVFIHSCGDVDELFEDLISIGVDCFNPFQPEVMDIDTLITRYRHRLCFWGGLSIQRTLPHGTVKDVRSATRHLIKMGRQGGYIFSPSHGVEGDTPVDNILAFIDEARCQ